MEDDKPAEENEEDKPVAGDGDFEDVPKEEEPVVADKPAES